MPSHYKNKKTGLVIALRGYDPTTSTAKVELPGQIYASLHMRRDEFEEQFEPYDNTVLLDFYAVQDDATLIVEFKEDSPPGFGEPFYLLKRIVIDQTAVISAFRDRATVYKDSREVEEE